MRVVRGRSLSIKREGPALVRVFATPADKLANASITEVELPAGSATPDHSHDTDQVVYVLEGEARFVGGGEDHALSTGDLIYIPAGATHRHESPGPGPLRQLSLFLTPRRVTSDE